MRTFMPENEQVAGGKRAEYVRPEQKLWLDRMAAKGWTAPTWPTQYGGGGLSNDEALILEEEMQDLGCRPPLRGMGLSMLGPVLLEYGTEEQRQTHIPPIMRGEIRWCQGYQRAGGRIRPRQPAHPRGAAGRAFPGQRPQDLDLQRASVRLDLLPGPHRPDGEKARRHQLPADRHG